MVTQRTSDAVFSNESYGALQSIVHVFTYPFSKLLLNVRLIRRFLSHTPQVELRFYVRMNHL
jgi:hypothetical protein